MSEEEPDQDGDSTDSIEDLFGSGSSPDDERAPDDPEDDEEPEGADNGGAVEESGGGAAGETAPDDGGGDRESGSEGDAGAVDAAEREPVDGADGDDAEDDDWQLEGEVDVDADVDEEGGEHGDEGAATDDEDAPGDGGKEPAEDGTEPVEVEEDRPPDGGEDAASRDAADGSDLIDVDDRSEPAAPVDSDSQPEDGLLSTGIDALDEHLGGGVPAGRILSLVATADTQGELLVKQLVSRHDCLYLSTLRPTWEVEEDVADDATSESDGASLRVEQLSADSRLDAARRHLEGLDSRSVVVIDAANELEDMEKDRYVYFLDDFKRTLRETGSVGLLYCIETEEAPVGRAVTHRLADVIWRLQRTVDSKEVRHRLVVSKFRGGRASPEPLELYLTDEVRVDRDAP